MATFLIAGCGADFPEDHLSTVGMLAPNLRVMSVTGILNSSRAILTMAEKYSLLSGFASVMPYFP